MALPQPRKHRRSCTCLLFRNGQPGVILRQLANIFVLYSCRDTIYRVLSLYSRLYILVRQIETILVFAMRRYWRSMVGRIGRSGGRGSGRDKSRPYGVVVPLGHVGLLQDGMANGA